MQLINLLNYNKFPTTPLHLVSHVHHNSHKCIHDLRRITAYYYYDMTSQTIFCKIIRHLSFQVNIYKKVWINNFLDK